MKRKYKTRWQNRANGLWMQRKLTKCSGFLYKTPKNGE
jgi:hypothetical protein